MANMQKEKTPMPEQEASVRAGNFLEVATGYTEEMALNEAGRCLNCKNMPCVSGCPVNVRIPEFIAAITRKEYAEAAAIIKSTSNLPAICGRVCPQETQCESKCVRGIKNEPVAIGRLERFAADYAMAHDDGKVEKIEKNGHKVAVIGSGPSGLTCAGDLAKLGYDVTVYEALHVPGGVLMYGIPEFRLPKKLVQEEIATVTALGVNIETDSVVGRFISIDELFEDGFEAIYVGSGAGLPSFMHMPGENLNGVYSANEFLTRINLMHAYEFPKYDTPVVVGESVAVVGGGNVAMDAARCAKRLGAKNVTIVYRRSEAEMPARLEEVHHAKEEGIIFSMLTNPVEVVGDDKGYVSGLKCVKMELGEPDASGRRRPVVIEGSEHMLDVQTVVIAIGNTPNPLISSTTPDLEINRKGCIVADPETGATSIPGVYAGGDIVTGAATVILAMGAGKKAAKAIDEYIKAKN